MTGAAVRFPATVVRRPAAFPEARERSPRRRRDGP